MIPPDPDAPPERHHHPPAGGRGPGGTRSRAQRLAIGLDVRQQRLGWRRVQQPWLRGEPVRQQQRPAQGRVRQLGRLGAPGNTSAIAAEASPALVDIATDLTYRDGEAFGTGIVLTSDGLILTNNHVISGATRVQVTDVGNHQTYPARCSATTAPMTSPWSSCKSASGLRTASIGNSSKVSVGEGIVGLGNAGGVGGTPSSAGGTVTALDQTITATDEGDGTTEQLSGLIQVNADIQPGDSGGALVDTSGHVIGIDTAASAGFDFQTTGGQGFAIPINEAIGIARQSRTARPRRPSTSARRRSWASWSAPRTRRARGHADRRRARRSRRRGRAHRRRHHHLGGRPLGRQAVDAHQPDPGYHPGQKVVVGWSDAAGQSHETTVTLTSGPAQ